MTFYGESWPVWDLVNLDGVIPVDFDAVTYHWDDTASVLGGGQRFLVSVQAAPLDVPALQGAAEEVVVSWALEVGPDSDGSVALASGVMPSSAPLSEDWVSEDLGVYPAIGLRTVVSRPTSIAVADLLDYSQVAVLRVECTGAPVQLLQVKLRVWPATGAHGAWLTGQGFEMHGGTQIMDSEPLMYGTPLMDSYESAWNRTKAEVSTWNGRIVNWLEKFGSGGAGQRLSIGGSVNPPYLPVGTVTMGVTILSAMPPVATQAGPRDVNAGFDPNEISIEPTAQIRMAEGVPVQTVFAGWPYPDAGVRLSSPAGQIGMLRRLPPQFRPSTELAGWVTETLEMPRLNGVAQSEGMLLPVLDEEHQTIAAFTLLYYQPDPPPEQDVETGTTLEVLAPYSLAVSPDYVYYSPTAVTVPARKPRFYVTFTEVDEHPRDVSHVVGIGKPANDASVFRVPTPLGTLRELRHGEAVSDVSVAYPLKVKLEDGSWTVVAGMTPDP